MPGEDHPQPRSPSEVHHHQEQEQEQLAPAHNEQQQEQQLPAALGQEQQPDAAANIAADDDAEGEHDDDVIELGKLVDDVNEENEKIAKNIALVGGQDATVCTYPEGYKPRQPLYACLTCAAEGGDVNGVCLGCKEHCHEGHELVELYTKRLFACDCGNKKFKQKCKLYENKLPLNVRNKYDHNFEGRFCVCDGPYVAETDHMVQCALCEDWFHEKHLENVHMMGDEAPNAEAQEEEEKAGSGMEEDSEEPPSSQSSEAMGSESSAEDGEEGAEEEDGSHEMVCHECTKKYPFILVYYYQLATVGEMPPVAKGECLLEKIRPQNIAALPTGTVEFDENTWRKALCHCAKCEAMYEDERLDFLFDDEDPLAEYEKLNEAKESAERIKAWWDSVQMSSEKAVFDWALAASGNNVPRAVDFVMGYMDMKKKLYVFIDEEANAGHVVTKNMVWDFFAQLQAEHIANRDAALEAMDIA